MANRLESISKVRWENRLLGLLREELASSPTRWRAAVRLTVLCVLGTAAVTAAHVSGGQFMVLMFFLVAMSDAPTSRAAVVPNMLGSFAGGAVGIVILAAFSDAPWIRFPLEGAVIAAAMYLMRTTSTPLAFLFFTVSFVIVVPEFLPAPGDGVYQGMRAMAFQTLGIGLGTLGQVLWWPENPEALLMEDLSESLRSVAASCRRMETAGGRDCEAPASVPARSLRTSAAHLFRQLDLLREAESEDSWLRQRHTEQVRLVTGVQVLVFLAGDLERRVAAGTPAGTELVPRLRAIREECDRLVLAISRRTVPEVGPVVERSASFSGSMDAVVLELERVLGDLPRHLAFLGTMRETGRTPPSREPVATRSHRIPVTPEERRLAVQFGLKVALAASLCGLLYQALDWPGIGTCVLTAVLVAQATVGLGRHKAALRFGGAVLAGMAVLVIVEVFMPNMESLASLLVVVGGFSFVAAWIATGSSRTAYLGVQMGVTLYLLLFPQLGPSLDLVPARDRLVGILLGIAAMAVVDSLLWPVFTPATLRRKVAVILRRLAELQDPATELDRARSLSVGVHRGIAEALMLQEELIFESGAADAQAEIGRQWAMQVMDQLQTVFLAVLAVRRERPAAAESNPGEAGAGGSVNSIPDRLRRLADVVEEAASGTLSRGGVPLESPATDTAPDRVRGTEQRVLDSVASLEAGIRRLATWDPAVVSAPGGGSLTAGAHP